MPNLLLLSLKQIWMMGEGNELRKVYLDNIRWATVILVLIYHVFYMFNGVGVLGGIPNAVSIPVFDWAASVIYPWFMVLLFVIAGMSARYALQERTEKQFLGERAVKLLIPSTLGLFVIHWITGYLNIKMGGGLEYIPSALVYPISVISGIGPLWFIQMLFLFSCILVLFRKMDKSDMVWTLCGKANLPVLLLLFLLIFGAAQILNMPVLTMYRFGIYSAAFFIGYYVFSHEGIQEIIEKACIPLLCLALAGAVFYAFRYGGSDYTSSDCLQSMTANLYLWLVVLAAIGCGRKYFNRENRFTRYMTKSSFGIYILHYPILIITCYALHYHYHFPAIWNYAIAFIVELIMTLAIYEMIKRVPGLRYLVFGIERKKEKNN